MSTWIEIKNKEDVEVSNDGKSIEILYSSDNNGNNYVDVPIEFIDHTHPTLDKQPMIRITTTKGKDLGLKKVISLRWDNNGRLWLVTVDFMQTGLESGYAFFYNYGDGLINDHENLRGYLVFK